jgi:(p)ppGpp synthase/HD superfamily hydrolase
MTLPKTYLTERFTQALDYAVFHHKNQPRKGTDITYISHPLGVASIVLEAGGSEDEAIAGLLHDVPEDCGGQVRLDEIKSMFGDNVARIVEACSDTLVEDRSTKPAWIVRKQGHLDHLKQNADKSILLVTAADKLHNARAIAADKQVMKSAIWTRFISEEKDFDKKRQLVLWYYNEVLKLVEATPVENEVDKNVIASLKLTIAVMESQD